MGMDVHAWQLAREQLWLITAGQLADLGFSRSAVTHRLRIGKLWLIYPGVYAVGHPELTRERRWMAAALACGDGSAVSHLCAAAHIGIWEKSPPARPHVAVPTQDGVTGPKGVIVHRCVTLSADEVEVVRGVRVTTLLRTLEDCAGLLNRKPLTSMVRQAQRRHGLSLSVLRAHVDEHPPSSFRHARLRRVVDAYHVGAALTDSEREALFFELCQARGLPLPSPQRRVGPYRVDFMWEDLRLIVEIDDRASHDGEIAFGEDRLRDRHLQAAGYVVIRFTVAELVNRPATVARELRRALARACKQR
jgi:very-short-patch-repair endonuclease